VFLLFRPSREALCGLAGDAVAYSVVVFVAAFMERNVAAGSFLSEGTGSEI